MTEASGFEQLQLLTVDLPMQGKPKFRFHLNKIKNFNKTLEPFNTVIADMLIKFM